MLFYNLHFSNPLSRKYILVLIPDPLQLVQIALVQLLNIFFVRRSLLHDLDRTTNNDIDRPAIRLDANIIVEDTTSMKRRKCKAKQLLKRKLTLVKPRVVLAVKLGVDIVFAERQHRHEIGARPHGQLDEALAAAQHKAEGAGARLQRLARAADHDGDGAAHAGAVAAAAAQQVLAAGARHARQPHVQDVLAVQRDAEVGVQRQQRVRDAGEQRREAQRLRAEGGEGSVRDDPVRVVPEDVLARWG